MSAPILPSDPYVAITVEDADSGRSDVWIFDVVRYIRPVEDQETYPGQWVAQVVIPEKGWDLEAAILPDLVRSGDAPTDLL